MLAPVVAGTLGLQLAAMAVPPLRSLLGLTPLSVADWALVGGATMLTVCPEGASAPRRHQWHRDESSPAPPNGHPRAARGTDQQQIQRAIQSAINSGEIVAVGVLHLVRTTIVTALAGVQDVGAEVGTAAVAAVTRRDQSRP